MGASSLLEVSERTGKGRESPGEKSSTFFLRIEVQPSPSHPLFSRARVTNPFRGKLSSRLYVFFVKSQSNRPETGAYLENTTLLIPFKLGSQGLILQLTDEAPRTRPVVFVRCRLP